jgi:hypothetical protein
MPSTKGPQGFWTSQSANPRCRCKGEGEMVVFEVVVVGEVHSRILVRADGNDCRRRVGWPFTAEVRPLSDPT